MNLLVRNLAKYGKRVVIEDRNESIINGLSREVFNNARIDRAIIKTVRGVKVFDSTNVERVATHRITIMYRPDVGSEQWIRREDSTKRLKILTVENCCENDEALILMCTERGEDSKIVNNA